MNLLAIVAALALEQWRTFQWRAALERAFVRYVRHLERKLNGGRAEQGLLALLAALIPPVVLAAAAYVLAVIVHPLLGVAWNIVVLYFLMGFSRFSNALSAIVDAFRDNDVIAARRALAAWRGGYSTEITSQDIARLAIERGLIDAYRQVFAVLFWFTVLPGPAGAVLYRAALLASREWRGSDAGDDVTPIARSRAAFGAPARTLLSLLDWIPVRLTALSFAIVGDFEDAAWCWRTQTRAWAREEGGVESGAILASGAGALGVQLGGPLVVPVGEPLMRPEVGLGDAPEPEVLPSAIGLVWRALILWLLVILLVTLANYAP
ncbi:MAG TPA: CobD/CbiB family protein [Casimicrobiaceae bacterium]|nr:CobD/CbiB family protein [Casimicrobiaceae bacterium]